MPIVGSPYVSGSGGVTTTLTVTAPNASPTQNNVYSLQIVQAYNSSSTLSPPDGTWVAASSNPASGEGVYQFTRVIPANDATAFTFTFSANSIAAYQIIEWSSVSTTTPLDQSAQGSVSGSVTNVSTSSITPTNANSQFVAIFGSADTGRVMTGESGWTANTYVSASHITALGEYNNSLASTATSASVTYSSTGAHPSYWGILNLNPASGGGTTYTESFAITGSGTVVLHNRIGKPFAMTGSGTAALTKRIGKPFSIVGSGSVSLVRRIHKVIAVTGSGIVGLHRKIAKAFAFTGSGAVTATFIRVKMLTFAIVGSGSVQLTRRIGKTIAVHGSGAVTLGRHITKAFAVVGSGAVRLTKRIAKAFSASGSGIVSAVVRKLGSVTLPPVNITVTFLSKVPVTVSFVSKAVITAAYKTKAIITAIFD